MEVDDILRHDWGAHAPRVLHGTELKQRNVRRSLGFQAGRGEDKITTM